MDEARVVLDRLERISALDSAGAPAHTLLEEVRALVAEAEEWLEVEPSARSAAALERCRESLAREEVGMMAS
jgi:hypothetical protein